MNNYESSYNDFFLKLNKIYDNFLEENKNTCFEISFFSTKQPLIKFQDTQKNNFSFELENFFYSKNFLGKETLLKDLNDERALEIKLFCNFFDKNSKISILKTTINPNNYHSVEFAQFLKDEKKVFNKITVSDEFIIFIFLLFFKLENLVKNKKYEELEKSEKETFWGKNIFYKIPENFIKNIINKKEILQEKIKKGFLTEKEIKNFFKMQENENPIEQEENPIWLDNLNLFLTFFLNKKEDEEISISFTSEQEFFIKLTLKNSIGIEKNSLFFERKESKIEVDKKKQKMALKYESNNLTIIAKKIFQVNEELKNLLQYIKENKDSKEIIISIFLLFFEIKNVVKNNKYKKWEFRNETYEIPESFIKNIIKKKEILQKEIEKDSLTKKEIEDFFEAEKIFLETEEFLEIKKNPNEEKEIKENENKNKKEHKYKNLKIVVSFIFIMVILFFFFIKINNLYLNN